MQAISLPGGEEVLTELSANACLSMIRYLEDHGIPVDVAATSQTIQTGKDAWEAFLGHVKAFHSTEP